MSSMVGSSFYQGEFEPSPNTRNDGQMETYKVGFLRWMGRGNETPVPGKPKDGASFTVSAPKPPPENLNFERRFSRAGT